MAKLSATSEYDTHIHIIGSGALSYPWYDQVVDNSPHNYLVNQDEYNGWTVTLTEEAANAVHGGVTVTLDHAQILKAIRRAAFDKETKVSEACVREARNFLFRRDETDFDSDTADQIIQVAMFGEVAYG